MQLSADQKKVMQDACSREAPREACGIIAGGRVIELPNRSTDPGTFRIVGEEAREVLRSEGLGPDTDVDGIWHTHPSGHLVASDLDLASHPWPAALVIATAEAVRIYRADPRS